MTTIGYGGKRGGGKTDAIKRSGAAFICTCGKPLRSAEALQAHKEAMGCRNARQRKRAARQRRLRREGKRP